MYFKYRDELATHDGLVFRKERIVIPPKLWRCIIEQVHLLHNGIEGTLKLKLVDNAQYVPNLRHRK